MFQQEITAFSQYYICFTQFSPFSISVPSKHFQIQHQQKSTTRKLLHLSQRIKWYIKQLWISNYLRIVSNALILLLQCRLMSLANLRWPCLDSTCFVRSFLAVHFTREMGQMQWFGEGLVFLLFFLFHFLSSFKDCVFDS